MNDEALFFSFYQIGPVSLYLFPSWLRSKAVGEKTWELKRRQIAVPGGKIWRKRNIKKIPFCCHKNVGSPSDERPDQLLLTPSIADLFCH